MEIGARGMVRQRGAGDGDWGKGVWSEGLEMEIRARVWSEGVEMEIGARVWSEGVEMEIRAGVWSEGVEMEIGARVSGQTRGAVVTRPRCM